MALPGGVALHWLNEGRVTVIGQIAWLSGYLPATRVRKNQQMEACRAIFSGGRRPSYVEPGGGYSQSCAPNITICVGNSRRRTVRLENGSTSPPLWMVARSRASGRELRPVRSACRQVCGNSSWRCRGAGKRRIRSPSAAHTGTVGDNTWSSRCLLSTQWNYTLPCPAVTRTLSCKNSGAKSAPFGQTSVWNSG
jgi:hypothetical protein